jgi:two-component system, NarL family, response regulator DesR
LNPTGKDGRKAIRVVIAEDQGMVLGALAALLEIVGDIAVIGRARNGKEALNTVLAQKPDIFITDIEMPEMTGLEVAAELRRRRAGARVIIVTTFARAGYISRALEVGGLRISIERYARGGTCRCGAGGAPRTACSRS